MKRWSRSALLMAVGGLVACTQPEASSNRLGTKSVQVTEGERQLLIEGLGADGSVIGKLRLELGRFYSLEDDADVEGRRIAVQVGEAQQEHVSAGTARLTLPLIGDPAAPMNQFLALPELAAPLAGWDVELVPRLAGAPAGEVAAGERPSAACTYATSQACGATSCTEGMQIAGPYGDVVCAVYAPEAVCCGTTHTAVYRICGYSSPFAPNPCGTPGPNGCSVCWSTAWSTSCSTSGSYSGAQECADPLVGQWYTAQQWGITPYDPYYTAY